MMDPRRSERCRCCGRRLKNPASIAIGIGPVCATYYAQLDFFEMWANSSVQNDAAPLLFSHDHETGSLPP
jgi:hypothetical protein